MRKAGANVVGAPRQRANTFLLVGIGIISPVSSACVTVTRYVNDMCRVVYAAQRASTLAIGAEKSVSIEEAQRIPPDISIDVGLSIR